MTSAPVLQSIAIRVHDLPAMCRFYAGVLGATFSEVEIAPGLLAQFGRAGPLLIKLVPLRDAQDFEGFPVTQLGFAAADPVACRSRALELGGRAEGQPAGDGASYHCAVRDPDGNTLEIFAAQGA